MKIIIQKKIINVCTCAAELPNKKRYVSCDKGHVRANFSAGLGPFMFEGFADVERDRASECTFIVICEDGGASCGKFAEKIDRLILDAVNKLQLFVLLGPNIKVANFPRHAGHEEEQYC